MHDGQIASEGVDSISVIALPRISLIKGERNRSQELRKKIEKNGLFNLKMKTLETM